MAFKGHPARSILITGGSSGIGQALAETYAAPGITLSLSGRDEERLAAVAEACGTKGADVDARPVDVTDAQAMVRWITERHAARPLDLVIANAGISGTFDGDQDGKTRAIFAVNMAGVLNTVLPVVPLMRERRRGHIAIMSSLAGLRGLPSAPAYSASKAAARAYGEAIRGRLARNGIRVSVICPGFVKSRITEKNTFPMPFLMSAPKAARIIRRGLDKGKAQIAFPWPLYATMRLISLLPAGLGDQILKRAPRKT